MKKYAYLLTIVVISLLFTITPSANDDVDKYINEFESTLPEELSGISNDPGELVNSASIKGLLSEIVAIVSEGRGEVASFFLVLIGALALVSLSSLTPSSMSKSVEAVTGIVASLLVFAKISALFSSVTSSSQKIFNFFGALIPLTSSITLAGGGVSTATVQSGGMYMALSLTGGVGGEIISAISSFCLSMSLVSSLGGDGILSVCKGAKSIFNWLIGILTALLTGALALQTVISSAVDSASVRTAKYMASGLIPVVGSTVSSALSTLASGLSYAKGIIGGGSILVLILLSLSPLVMLLLYRLALTICIILADFVGSGAGSRIFTSYRFALDTLVTYYSITTLILIIQIVLFIKVGVAVL